jgi:dihydroorotate dehydrogenase electron transfer subunit
MKQWLCRVAGNTRLVADVQQMSFDAAELAATMQPGQFALVRDPRSFDPYLRRTAWFYDTDRTSVVLTLLSTDPIAVRAREGDMLDLLAPLGRAVDWPESARHLLLIGQGSHIPPLIAMARRAVRQGRSVVLSIIATTDREVFPAHLLPPEVEYQAGAAVNPELFAWADVLMASGSEEMYRLLGDSVRGVRFRLERGFMYVLVDLPMPCGTGECHACAVKTSRGIKLACTEGPVFDWLELENRRAR